MKTDQFKTDLGKNWARKDSENQGLPYLLSVTPPKQTDIEEITVQLLVATYDTESYGFQKATDVIDVTVESSGNTRVIDVMDAAQDQGKITYTYTVSPAYGSFIETINGKTLSSPDGWMFTVNDTLSNVSATLASVDVYKRQVWLWFFA